MYTDQIFARQVQALGQPGDLLIGISTSGRSTNVIEAIKVAQSMNIKCPALLGNRDGELLHLLCEFVERRIEDSQIETAMTVEQKIRSNSWAVTHSDR